MYTMHEVSGVLTSETVLLRIVYMCIVVDTYEGVSVSL